MGVTNGNASFQRILENLLVQVRDCAVAFSDEVIIASREPSISYNELLEAHESDVNKVLDLLVRHKITGSSDNANIAVTRFCKYYSAYIKLYAQYTAFTTAFIKGYREETKKGSKKALFLNDDLAFGGMKQVLHLVAPDRGFFLQTDASDYAIGAALQQVLDDWRHVPVPFASRVLAEGQRRIWTPREKEAYAIVMAVRKWAEYIALHPVTVYTDHQSLQSWHKVHLDSPSGPARRRARLHETLAKFDLTVVYVPRKDNTLADCPSRLAYHGSKGMTDVSANSDEPETAEAKKIIDMRCMMEGAGLKCIVVIAADAPLGRRGGTAVRALATEGTKSDKHLIPDWCLQDDWTDDYAKSEAFQSEYRGLTDPGNGQRLPNGLSEEDGKFYRNGKLLVPESGVLELCRVMHPGVRKQALDMQHRFQINEIGLYNAIEQVRKGCLVCQACNPDNLNVKEEAKLMPIADQPMERMAMDIFSLPEVHIGREVSNPVVLCVDRHSGYIVAVPSAQIWVASQGSRSYDDLSLAGHLWHPPHHLQRLWTPVHWRLVQGHVFPDGDTACEERCLS